MDDPWLTYGPVSWEIHGRSMGDPWANTVNSWATDGSPAETHGDPWESIGRPMGRP